MNQANSKTQIVRNKEISIMPKLLGNWYIARAFIPKTPENPHNVRAACFLLSPLRIRRWDKWSRPPVKGEMPRFNRETTATVVSNIGTAMRESGIAKDMYEGAIPGLRRIVSTETMIPKKSAPASPM